MPNEGEKTGKPEQSLVSVGINDKAELKSTDEGDIEGSKTEKEKKETQKKIKREKIDQGKEPGSVQQDCGAEGSAGKPKQTTTVVETEDSAQEHVDTTPEPQAALDDTGTVLLCIAGQLDGIPVTFFN